MGNNEKDFTCCCSFCGKTEDKVKKLIEGPGVYICNECVDLCYEIFEDEFEDINPETAVDDVSDIPKPKEITIQLTAARKAPGNSSRIFVFRFGMA